jgi:hypothetical protein
MIIRQGPRCAPSRPEHHHIWCAGAASVIVQAAAERGINVEVIDLRSLNLRLERDQGDRSEDLRNRRLGGPGFGDTVRSWPHESAMSSSNTSMRR